MTHTLYDSVVLDRDLPEHGLQRGDLGTVVELYHPDGVEVEFLTASGDTQAVVTLHETDVRAAATDEMVSVRQLRRSA